MVTSNQPGNEYKLNTLQNPATRPYHEPIQLNSHSDRLLLQDRSEDNFSKNSTR